MMGIHETTVIIVTFNSAHCAVALAGGLRELPHVLLVDNASEDGTIAAFQQVVPQVKIIRNSRNLGFGAACNIGIAIATTPYVLLVNPDVVFGSEQLTVLFDVAQHHPQAAIIAPHLEDVPARGDGIVASVDFVSGAFFLARTADLGEIGGFDEQFFLYYEDDDLCRRLRQRGKTILSVPWVRVIHQSRRSVGTQKRWRTEYLRGYHHVQSKLRFARKHGLKIRGVGGYYGLLLGGLLQLPLHLIVWSPRHLARCAGRVHGLMQYRDSVAAAGTKR